MKKGIIPFIILFSAGLGTSPVHAQTSASNNLTAQPIPDRTVYYNLADTGVSKPVTWGLDLAWLSEENIRRGVAFVGADNVDVVRSSFTPTSALVNGDLPAAELATLNQRLTIINKWLGPNTKVALNCDHPSVAASYLGNAANWAQLMDVTTRRTQEAGRKVVSISPFNEPDYGWGQYTGSNGQIDFYNIAVELRKNSRFDSIRICGANTLNCDQALPWYNYLKSKLDEGNTHQLAGSFDNFANFYTTVRANGDHATADEMHNVMEAMVGYEYGLQTGIWWGTAELARGEFVKASHGVRLGYAEHRPNWTAASVYRGLDGKVEAFGGTSERQAVTTTYRFVSKDRDVFYDGQGPQREYTMVLPGGTGYQNGQTNAERVVNINWGDDIQPAINGQYILVNRNSGKVMQVAGGLSTPGTGVVQNTSNGATYQRWKVTPVDSRIGGDFSYFTFTAVHSGMVLDLLNWSLENGGSIDAYTSSNASIQQWYLDYAEDGWFYIRSRFTAKCLQVAGSSTAAGASINQYDKNGTTSQQWRFLPVSAPVEFIAPSAPGNLTATPNAVSIRLDWSASPESDVAGYSIFRSETAGGPYYTIARNVTSTSFIDNTATTSVQHFYTIKAVDNSLNRSNYSNEVSASATGNHDLVAHLQFDGNTMDSTINLNHSAASGSISYVSGKVGSGAIVLNGTNSFVQLPANVANEQEISIAAWVYSKGGVAGQRIFDFGNDPNSYIYLATRNNAFKMHFAIKNGGAEQSLDAPMLSVGSWSHVVVTLGASGVKIYINGQLKAESGAITISPLDLKPVLNYIGRSQQSTDPLFSGNIDDFRVYNYPLSADEVAQLAGVPNAISELNYQNKLSVWPTPANNILHVSYSTNNNNSMSTLTVFNVDGSLVLSKDLNYNRDTELNISNLPSGVYMLKLTNREESLMKKLIIKH